MGCQKGKQGRGLRHLYIGRMEGGGRGDGMLSNSSFHLPLTWTHMLAT